MQLDRPLSCTLDAAALGAARGSHVRIGTWTHSDIAQWQTMCGRAQSVEGTEYFMVSTSMTQKTNWLYVLQDAWLHKGCSQHALSAA